MIPLYDASAPPPVAASLSAASTLAPPSAARHSRLNLFFSDRRARPGNTRSIREKSVPNCASAR